MRMWMLPPEKMCRQHLLGEHLECHMIAGGVMKDQWATLRGLAQNFLIELDALESRHDALAHEMTKRGYKHNAGIGSDTLDKIRTLPAAYHTTVDVEKSERDLRGRCEACNSLYLSGE